MRRLSAIALAAVALAGCGGDDESSDSEADSTPAPAATEEATQAPSAGGGGEEIALAAVENGPGDYGWDPAELSAKAGAVTITMDNPGSNQAPHAVAIEGAGVNESGELANAGQKSEVSAELEAGEYVFFCPVGNHRADGMEGTLTVE